MSRRSGLPPTVIGGLDVMSPLSLGATQAAPLSLKTRFVMRLTELKVSGE